MHCHCSIQQRLPWREIARQARALGVWAVGGAVATALGPLLGGVLGHGFGSPLPTMPSEGTSTPPPELGETPIKVTVADRVITARLADNATARDLAAQLPLTLTFKDFNRVEKIAPLPRPLSMDGAPAGADPDIGDIGYYAPSGDLVFYYGDVGYWNGIVRIGRFDTTMELIEQQDDNFQVGIERS